MELYLVQHGEATSREESADRPLTLQGRADVDTVAAFVARRAIVNVSCIFHSGQLRALQSAEIIAEHFGPKDVLPVEKLTPDADPTVWARYLAKRTDGVMLVGHLPYLNRLTSLLLCGDLDREIVKFRMGGMVALGRNLDNIWTIRWAVTPDIVS